jgi:uncharacterized protein
VTRALLDVNVLLALFDGDHVDHGRAHAWLDTEIGAGWASCPITQNGFVRVISQPRYPSPITAFEAFGLLSRACGTEYHDFWPCDISLLDHEVMDSSRLHGARQITDSYLLALAVARGGRLVTFDRSLSLAAVRGATAAHLTVL